MTEEQIFKNRFPEYCVGEKCLSPYFDLFQIGFEEGEKQNDVKLDKAKELLKDWLQIAHKNHARCYGFVKDTEEFLDKQIEATYNMYKENVGLKEQVSALSKALVLNTSDEKLEKAKEIIKALLKHTYGQNLNTQNDFNLYLGKIKDAETFLKEIEK